MGRWAADHLLERISNGHGQPQAVRIRGHVVEGDSVARPR
jgi:DNA-binding LacI/PurR family transcriptional regulator